MNTNTINGISDIVFQQNTEVGRIAELKEECIHRLDREVHVHRTVSLVSGDVDMSVIYSVAVICHCLMSQHKYSIHKRRLVIPHLIVVGTFCGFGS